jgi:hypothetical protein
MSYALLGGVGTAGPTLSKGSDFDCMRLCLHTIVSLSWSSELQCCGYRCVLPCLMPLHIILNGLASMLFHQGHKVASGRAAWQYLL